MTTERGDFGCDLDELSRLWHLSRTALACAPDRGRLARVRWAAREYAKAHPEVTEGGAYKDLDRMLERGGR